MNDKVSIIIPTYNRVNIIRETLQSILAQTYSNWECIIVDDGSTDDTQHFIKKFVEKDCRFKLLSRPANKLKGPSACRNFGITKSTGGLLLFFDDDDIMHPQNLEFCVQELSRKDIYFCKYLRTVFCDDFDYIFNYSKKYSSFEIDSKEIESLLKFELFFVTGSVIWKRECFATHRFVEELVYAEDWEVYSRILSSGLRGISINKCLFFGRKHSSAITAKFYMDNIDSKRSYCDAILLVIKNLKDKNLLSYSILRYFIQLSLNFTEFNLFQNLLDCLNLSKGEKIKWRFFYTILPARLKLYRFKKKTKEAFINFLVK
jgi:glycosyltransferase involved in cell wall biosynthesis